MNNNSIFIKLLKEHTDLDFDIKDSIITNMRDNLAYIFNSD